MPIAATPIITLDDAKDFLGITNNTSNTEITDVIAAASQMIVNRIGHVLQPGSSVDEWHDGGSERIVLRNQSPIQSVTAVTENYGSITYTLTQVTLDSGASGVAFGYTVDLDEGLLVRRASGVAIPFMGGVRNIHVTYVAGYASAPADIQYACKVLVKHLWEPKRGSGTRYPGTGGDEPPASPFAFPDRVEEILAAYSVPGIG